MFRRAQDRIRTYFYKTREELLKNPSLLQANVRFLIEELRNRLKIAQFHGYYFDRRWPTKSLCDSKGDFVCQGRWDRDKCLYVPQHRINPYASREGRIVFQTWNLDHGVERSRAVVPAVCVALKRLEGVVIGDVGGDENKLKCLDIKGIYDDLFSLGNLKFVHIVCHDKGAHKEKVAGPYLMY